MEFGLVQWFPYGGTPRIRRVVRKLEALGVERIRTQLSWADWCRPDGPAWIRFLIDELAGLDILPVLHSTPPSLGEKPFTSSIPRDLGSFAYFVRSVCQEHGDRFTHVQLWNEPTTWCDWDRDADRWWKRFAEMIRYAAAEAKEAGKQVVLGGISPPDGSKLGRFDPYEPHFLEILESEGALVDVDVVAFHGFPGTPHWSEGWGGWGAEITGVRAWASTRRMETWITETGSSRLMNGSRVAELREVVAAAEAGGIERVYWYSVEDVTWKAQREINLPWDIDPHDYATGLTPDLEAEIRRRFANGGRHVRAGSMPSPRMPLE
jgi:CDP-paratose 2-epimerase